MNVQAQRVTRFSMALLTVCLALAPVAVVVGFWPGAGPVRAAPAITIRYVSTTGSDSGGCASSASPCASLQYAVDQATPGDEIRVETGSYTGAIRGAASTSYRMHGRNLLSNY